MIILNYSSTGWPIVCILVGERGIFPHEYFTEEWAEGREGSAATGVFT